MVHPWEDDFEDLPPAEQIHDDLSAEEYIRRCVYSMPEISLVAILSEN